MPISAHALARLAAGALLALAGTTSHAAAVHFNFENTGTPPVAATDNLAHDMLTFGRSGITLNITAITRPNDAAAYAALVGGGHGVYFGDTGLGVLSLASDDDHNMDGASDGVSDSDVDEGLVFTFDRDVVLTDINFGRWSNTNANPNLDAIRFLVDGAQVLVHTGIDDSPSGLTLRGREFRFLAENDSTSVRIQDIDILTVPAPGVLGLMGCGLLLLCRARHDRRPA